MTKQEINEAIKNIDDKELPEIQSEVIKIYAISEILQRYFDYCVSGTEQLGGFKMTIIYGALNAIFGISENLVHSKLDDLINEISDLNLKLKFE